MKKELVFVIFLLVTAGLFGQNTFKYEVRVPSLRVGTATTVKVDSISNAGGILKFYVGASEMLTNASAVTGFTPAGGSLTLTGADALTINTTAATNVTFPTSGTLATTSDINDTLLAGQQIGVIADLKADTIPIFVFGLGSGQTADTAVFNDNAIAGAFYNAGSDTLMVTSIRGVLAEGTGTETIGVQVSWHATFKSGSATNLNSSAYTVTSITTGDEDTSFAASTIPPNVWVWCTLSGTSAGNRPSLLILTMSGYKQNRSY